MLKRKLYTWVIKKCFFPPNRLIAAGNLARTHSPNPPVKTGHLSLSPQLSSKRGSHLTTAYWPWSLFSLPVSTDVV